MEPAKQYQREWDRQCEIEMCRLAWIEDRVSEYWNDKNEVVSAKRQLFSEVKGKNILKLFRVDRQMAEILLHDAIDNLFRYYADRLSYEADLSDYTQDRVKIERIDIED